MRVKNFPSQKLFELTPISVIPMAMALVSIITPAYNSTRTLGETIESVQAQSFTDWEMIIVDDASGDGTTALASRYAADDARIRVIRRHENGGVAVARNQALAAATGRYIAFLDADDLWLPEKLALQMQFMAENDATISCTAFRRFKEIDKPGRIRTCPSRVTFDVLTRNTCVGMLTVMIDRDRSGSFEFEPDRHGYEDLALWLVMTKAGHDILFFNRDLARYRNTPGSLSSRVHISAWRTWRAYRDVAGLPPMDAFVALFNYGLRALLKRIF
jgi:teichuronic acid biosynthesis glycosyltransferase TuaG